jgi:hypothetical protein
MSEEELNNRANRLFAFLFPGKDSSDPQYLPLWAAIGLALDSVASQVVVNETERCSKIAFEVATEAKADYVEGVSPPASAFCREIARRICAKPSSPNVPAVPV